MPDLMFEVDNVIYGASSPLAAIAGLRRVLIDRAEIPSDVISELIAYVSDAIDIKSAPLAQFDMHGLSWMVDDEGEMTRAVVDDPDEYLGGQWSVVGKVEGLYVASGMTFVDRKLYPEEGMRWGVEIAVYATDDRHRWVNGGRVSVSTSNIRDIIPVTPKE